jgi:two-component sensor histidine kinase
MRLLMDELNHRVKNMLAVIEAMAAQTRREAHDLESFWEPFQSRLHSIATVHKLLTKTDWQGAALREVIESEVRARTSGQRFSASGPEMLLSPRKALAVQMLVHELATNACKYGGLRPDGGRLDVTWEAMEGAGSAICLEWTEQAPERVRAPRREGFGTRLMRQLVEFELGGELQRQFRPEGLSCRVTFPLSETPRRASPAAQYQSA